MKLLRFAWHRCTAAGGLRYRGTFTTGGHRCRVYSSHPVAMQTDKFMRFEGGIVLLAKGGISDSSVGYGRVVAIWSEPDNSVHFYSATCVR